MIYSMRHAPEIRACSPHSISHGEAISPTSRRSMTILGSSKEPSVDDPASNSRPRNTKGTKTIVSNHRISKALGIHRWGFAVSPPVVVANLSDANLSA